MNRVKISFRILLPCLILFSCRVININKTSLVAANKIKTKVVENNNEHYVKVTNNRIEAKGLLHNIIFEITKCNIEYIYECFKTPIPQVEILIEKPKGCLITNHEIFQIVSDSFGYVIEKQDYWLEKLTLSLIDSTKFKEKVIVYNCVINENSLDKIDMGMKMSSDYNIDSVFSTLNSCLSILVSYYKTNDYKYPDTITKEGVYIPDVNQHPLYEYKRYNNEVLPYDVEFKIDKSFNYLKNYCASIAIPNNIAGNLGYLYNYLNRMGILLKVKVEKRNRYVIRCLAPIPVK